MARSKDAELTPWAVGPDAAWRGTLISTAQYVRLLQPGSPTTAMSELEGWRWELALEDPLHCIFLGVGGSLSSSPLSFLCAEISLVLSFAPAGLGSCTRVP